MKSLSLTTSTPLSLGHADRPLLGRTTRLGPDLEQSHGRLAAVMGAAEAVRIFRQCLVETRLADVATPQEEFAFAESLCRQGGFTEIVGREVKVRAMMAGATIPSPSAKM